MLRDSATEVLSMSRLIVSTAFMVEATVRSENRLEMRRRCHRYGKDTMQARDHDNQVVNRSKQIGYSLDASS